MRLLLFLTRSLALTAESGRKFQVHYTTLSFSSLSYIYPVEKADI